MTYQKPEITVLGEASDVVLGIRQKATQFESVGKNLLPSDCEFDD